MVARLGPPKGAIVAGTAHGVAVGAHLGVQRGTARQLPYVEAEWTPPLTVDERHCQWVASNAQCMSWPVKNKPNPTRYCAGHLRKLNAADPGSDEDVRQVAS